MKIYTKQKNAFGESCFSIEYLNAHIGHEVVIGRKGYDHLKNIDVRIEEVGILVSAKRDDVTLLKRDRFSGQAQLVGGFDQASIVRIGRDFLTQRREKEYPA